MRGAQAAAGPTPAAKKQATVRETVSARTRGARRRNETSTLPIQPAVALNLARVYALHHDETFLHMAAVCTAWKRAAEQACHLVRDTTFGELKSGRRTGRFDRPHSVCFMPNRSMVIADCDNFRLQFWSRSGTTTRAEVELLGGTACPTAVAVAGAHIYVVEHGSHTVSKLRASSGALLTRACGWGGGDSELRHPWGGALAGQRLFVMDAGNSRVCCFSTSNLTFKYAFGERGFGPANQYSFVAPKGMAFYEGELFVADAGAHCLWVFDTEGSLLRVVGRPGSEPGRFRRPMGVAAANGRLYVTEHGGERLQVLDLQGNALQILRFGVPLSGVCADNRHVVVTAVEPELGGLDMQAPKKLPPAVHMLEVCQQSLSFEAEALGSGT